MKRAIMLTAAFVMLLMIGTYAVSRRAAPRDAPKQEQVPPETLQILMDDGSVQVMTENDYLTGVLLAELPGSFHAEAKKAQAVVSRTYARRRIGSSKHAGDVCTNPACCQGFAEPEDFPDQIAAAQARAAVRDTAGEVLVYDGALIDATFFSCSGGRTEAAVAVWGTDVPYLQSVESPGENAPHNEDSLFFTAEDFAACLGRVLEDSPASWLGEITETPGGAVAEMEIAGKRYTGTQLRQLLGLRSAMFTLIPAADGIQVQSRGFGHRVGMSQYGAQAMAEEGRTYAEILLHYYLGAQLVTQSQI